MCTVADPGFPIGGGGHRPIGGVPTSDTYTFRQKHMQKRKKLILLGGVRRRRPWIRQWCGVILHFYVLSVYKDGPVRDPYFRKLYI